MAGSTGFEPATSRLTGLEGPRHRPTVPDKTASLKTWTAACFGASSGLDGSARRTIPAQDPASVGADELLGLYSERPGSAPAWPHQRPPPSRRPQLSSSLDAAPATRWRPPGPAAAPLRSLLDREPVAAQDGPGQRAIAVLTLAFAPVTRAMLGVRLGPAGEAVCRPPASRGEGAEGTACVRPMRFATVLLDAGAKRAELRVRLLPVGDVTRDGGGAHDAGPVLHDQHGVGSNFLVTRSGVRRRW
jgi:hypothetical protein